jgi:EAL domain-containing protein (putative c-di-GMP-specific phosphodiesterase class I)
LRSTRSWLRLGGVIWGRAPYPHPWRSRDTPRVARTRPTQREPGVSSRNCSPAKVWTPISSRSSSCALVASWATRRSHGSGFNRRAAPADWFAEAAELELDVELELAAVRSAISTATTDGAAGALSDKFLSINAGPAAICDDDFEPALDGFLREELVIEVTEHAAISDYQRFRAKFSPFAARGARLAVDDTGAGYASLRHILQLGPQVIKLDLSLIRDIDRDPARRVLAATLLEFAHQTDTAVIAEGIETDGELGTLVELGVGYGQGFLLGRPRPLIGSAVS